MKNHMCQTCLANASRVSTPPAERDVSWPTGPQSGCTCHNTWSISIPPGEHFHPCKVHPEVFYVGTSYTFSRT